MDTQQNKVTLGLIGPGVLAQRQHLPNMARIPEIYLKTVCDLDSTLLGMIKEKYQVPCITSKYQELFSDPEIQGVVISTNENIQARLTIEALNAGKHVYVEKPLANTVEDCEAVVAAQKKTGKFVYVGFNRRFSPSYQKARELIRSHGGAFNIHYRLSDGTNLCKNHGPVRYKRPSGSRVIYELCHIFDVFRWLTDSDVDSILCMDSRIDDEAYLLRMKSGCVATLMHSSYTTGDLPKERLEVVAEAGYLTVDNFVELRTFGWKETSPVYTFPGHTHPDYEHTFRQKYLFEKLGADALYAILRTEWENTEKLLDNMEDRDQYPDLVLIPEQFEASMKGNFTDMKEMLRSVCNNLPFAQYRFDKGWLPAIRDFACSIKNNLANPNAASAIDGLKSIQVGKSAIQSRRSKEILRGVNG